MSTTNSVANGDGTYTYSTTLTDLGITKFVSASKMFRSQINLLEVKHMPNTSNVTDMSNMFSSCSGLTSIDLSGWDTSNVTNMSLMFNGCSSLTTLTLGKVSQETYDFWYQQLVNVGKKDNVTIVYTLI